MSLRAGHGKGAGSPRIEVLPADELPKGVQATEHAEAGSERRGNGTFAKGASTAQSKGGRTRKETTALSARLGLGSLAEDPAFLPYKRSAATFRRTHCTSLARTVGGGTCGTGPSSIVATAAWQLAASRYLFDRAAQSGDPALFEKASRLANDSRQNLLAAHELCAREAKGRPQLDPIARLQRELNGSDDGS